MGTPAIAIRFRDTTAGIDTISAHQKIIDSQGTAWWGWWKKDFEDPFLMYLDELPNQIDIFIVDRSTSRMFLAASSERIIPSNNIPSLHLIPDYYKHSAASVFGWFRLSSIEECEYNNDIGNLFGDGTIAILNSHAVKSDHIDKLESTKRSNNSSVLVLSDLHFGEDYEFLTQGEDQRLGEEKYTLTECVFEDLKRLGLDSDIGAILITGDFTSNGDWSDAVMKNIVAEMTALGEVLGVEKNSLLALPGNHDVVRYGEAETIDPAKIAVEKQVTFKHERDFRIFLNELLDRDVKAPLDRIEVIRLKRADLRIAILNSCRILATKWTEYGYVGPNGCSVIEQLSKNDGDLKTYRMLAVHHHLLPVNHVETPNSKGVTLSLDASKILETAQKAGVHIAIHGHQHMPHLSRYQSLPLMGGEETPAITVISNGSSGVSSKRRPGEERNTYCILTFTEERINLKMRELRSDKKQGNSLYDGTVS
ncbi:metallophosphoesterase [Hoeflea sp. YIM 152468]|uniref:metallophosphoesterase family protein n=1 Tax=Hoeflea sp. YIM 152468 TaxID=3031759 RepID=UPI0023DA5432|nr:metallophosphoesterase [Hoeflea sp. YIM 152468]MDF1607975.1 metallophosphoesterase [Hoeflea sp. YIM 152468]